MKGSQLRLHGRRSSYKYRLFVPLFLCKRVLKELDDLVLDCEWEDCRGGMEFFFRVKREMEWVSRHVVKEEFSG